MCVCVRMEREQASQLTEQKHAEWHHKHGFIVLSTEVGYIFVPLWQVTPRKKFKCPECTAIDGLSLDQTHMVER